MKKQTTGGAILRVGFGLTRASLGLAVIGLLPGCYGTKTLRQPITVEEIASDVGEIRAAQENIEYDIQKLEEQVGAQSETIQALQAENQYLYKELEDKLASIDAKLQDVIGRNTGFSGNSPYWSGAADSDRDSNDSYSGTPDWTGAADDDDGGSGGGWENLDDDVDQGNSSGSGSVLDREYVSDPGDGQSKRVYDQAYLDLTRGNYSLAILGFKEYLRREPSSELSDNAQYWIGESYYMRNDFKQAIREYGKVVDNHGSGDRAPASLYKLGLAKLQLGERADGVDYLRRVYETYPETEEARLARDKLDSLN